MKKEIYIIILLLMCRICNAQNLVPNGDFEQYSTCPSAFSQLDSALFWLNPTSCSPDYFNQCSNPSSVGVPNNFSGFQLAHSGVGYGGFYLRSNSFPNQREYIEIPFLSPLLQIHVITWKCI